MVSYEQILVADELSRSVQRAGRVPVQWREDLFSREQTRHEVRAKSEGRSRRAG